MDKGPTNSARNPNGGGAAASTATPSIAVPPTTYRSKTEEALRRLVRNPLGLALIIILALLILTYPFLDEAFQFRKITSVVPILMYILLALGLNVVVGYAGLLDLGYAAFFAIGAYAAAFVTSPRSILYSSLHDWGLGGLTNFWVAIIVAFFIAVIA